MTYNIILDVPAPIELYDASHAAVRDVVGGDDVGLVVHVARATDAGFEILEIWQSREACQDFYRDTWPQVAARIPGAGDLEPPPAREFDIRGLIVAGRADLSV